MEDQIKQQLENFAEKKDLSFGEVKQRYQEKLEEARDHASDMASDEEIQQIAVTFMQADSMESGRVSGGGDRVEILSIGHAGERKWSNGDGGKKRVVISYGVINPEQGPPGVAVFINDETTGTDLGEIKEKFNPLNTMVGWYRVNQSQNLSNVYICNSTDKTRLDVQPVDGIPDDKSKKRQLLQKLSDEAELAHISNAISITNDQGYPVDFGADLKRFNGAVMDRYVNDEKGFGIYKVMDKSVVDEEDLEGLNVMGENDRVPGISVWCDPEQMRYGENSQLEIYGQIRVTNGGANEGQIVMDAYGIIPLIEMPVQDDDDSRGSSTSASNVEETTI